MLSIISSYKRFTGIQRFPRYLSKSRYQFCIDPRHGSPYVIPFFFRRSQQVLKPAYSCLFFTPISTTGSNKDPSPPFRLSSRCPAYVLDHNIRNEYSQRDDVSRLGWRSMGHHWRRSASDLFFQMQPHYSGPIDDNAP